MRHGSKEMVNKVYGHLGDVRHRSEVVEYQVKQHLETPATGSKGLVWHYHDTAAQRSPRMPKPRPHRSASGGNVPEWARRDSNARPLAPEASALSN